MVLFYIILLLIIVIALKAKTIGSVNKLSGPLVILKLFFEILNFIFFLPGLELFMAIFNCKSNENGILYHTYF